MIGSPAFDRTLKYTATLLGFCSTVLIGVRVSSAQALALPRHSAAPKVEVPGEPAPETKYNDPRSSPSMSPSNSIYPKVF